MHILINDFIGGVLDRGMPLYVRNLIDGLKTEGFRVSIVRAPRICRRLPRNVFYMLAVLVEQTILPLMGLLKRTDATLYPYNSIAVLDILTKRGRIVVHDLEQLNRPASLSKSYYLACYRAIKWRNWPVFTISKLSERRLRESDCFGDGPITILPNTFYAFEQLLKSKTRSPEDERSILLCTGSTANKDLESVIDDYLPKALAKGFQVSVLGLHKMGDAPRFASLNNEINSGQLRLCGQLSDAEVVAVYQRHDIIWVHSLREGFGRCVVEGRLAGRRVICSDIPEFSELRDEDVTLYKNSAEFLAALDRLGHTDTPAVPYTRYPYRALLRNAISSGL